MIVVDLAGYYYRVRPNSTMTQAFNEKNLDILMVGNKLIDSFKDDTDILPYIGYLLFDSGYSHYLKDGINKKSPYVDLYENFIQNAAFLAKQSKEIVAKHRLLRLYLFAPKYYMTITYPLYQFFYRRWLLIRKIVMAHKK